MISKDLRNIPSVNAIVRALRVQVAEEMSEQAATEHAKALQGIIRAVVLGGSSETPDVLLERAKQELSTLLIGSRYSPVLNGTGIIVHTNLGRAPVSAATATAMARAAQGAVALEVEPESGRRGGRMAEISGLVRLLTGADASLVVNNNAAAVLLVLSALARHKRVAVSRSEAVEIGGGFRVPDILQQSGAELIEVGTTNRTYASDYRRATEDGADILLKVHLSNFAITGFTATPTLDELAEVARETRTLLIEDLGSGTLLDTAKFGIGREPTIQYSVMSGVDLVMFSGDKLLGGPQAGIIAGRQELVDRIARAPLARAMRADKVTLAGIAATLRHYVRGDAVEQLPVWRMISASRDGLEARATKVCRRVTTRGVHLETEVTTNYVGGGSLPEQALPGVGVSLTVDGCSAEDLARRLRVADMPVFGRIEHGRLFIELRTILPEHDERLIGALEGVIAAQ
jgi:L-seryl-tRNA(Ser) seleniumtransferase